MVAKSAFILRSLFVAFTLGSLVACTFEGQSEGEDDETAERLARGRARPIDSILSI